jgi:hypothetical protein
MILQCERRSGIHQTRTRWLEEARFLFDANREAVALCQILSAPYQKIRLPCC